MGERSASDDLDRLIDEINVDRSHGARRPHKPLLLLYAIARLVGRGEKKLEFRDAEPDLARLLEQFAPPTDRPRPEYPWWRLQGDGLWVVEGASAIKTNQSGDAAPADLRRTRGGLPDSIANVLLEEPARAARAVRRLLDAHFSPTLHEDVIAAVGFDAMAESPVVETGPGVAAELVRESVERWSRPSAFSRRIRAAYQDRCAVTGYRAEVDGRPIAMDAAHVRWQCKGGPSEVMNGLALQPLLHRLLDRGAWSLDDERRVIISPRIKEDAESGFLAPLAGRRLREPSSGHPPVHLDHIRWHREPRLGGIFRT